MAAEPNESDLQPESHFALARPVTGIGPSERRMLFHPVALAGLRADLAVGFDLYMRMHGGERFVLYRRSDFVFTSEQRARLLESGVRDVFIAAKDRDAYLGYLESHLEEIVADASVPAPERSSIVYECSAALVREALRRPWAAENHLRTRRLVGATVTHLLRGPEQITSMIRLLSTDYRLYTHSVNVCVLGLALAERTGLSAEEMRDLGAGLLLHDVGLADVSPAVLTKHARLEPLTGEEQALYQLHPQRGADFLRRAQQCAPGTLAVVQQHHERCNGRGYPAAARGARIHFYAKIAAVADVFDELTTCGGGEDARTSFEALAAMQGEMARAFQADLLRSLILLLGRAAVREEPESAPSEAPDPADTGRSAGDPEPDEAAA